MRSRLIFTKSMVEDFPENRLYMTARKLTRYAHIDLIERPFKGRKHLV